MVVLNGRNHAKLAEAVDLLRAEGLSVHARDFDVTQAVAVQAAIEDIESSIGPIDILVNNAGMMLRGPLDEFAVEDWHRIMRTNIDSVFLVGQRLPAG